MVWPPRSLDMSPLDFFLWGYMKTLTYETPVESEMGLVARIVVAARKITENLRVFERDRQSCVDIHSEQKYAYKTT